MTIPDRPENVSGKFAFVDSTVSPIEKKEGQNCREVGRRGVRWQVKDKQNNNTARRRYQVVQLGRKKRKKNIFRTGEIKYYL